MFVVTTKKSITLYHSTHHFPCVNQKFTINLPNILLLLYSRRLYCVILALVDDITKEALMIVSQVKGVDNVTKTYYQSATKCLKGRGGLFFDIFLASYLEHSKDDFILS